MCSNLPAGKLPTFTKRQLSAKRFQNKKDLKKCCAWAAGSTSQNRSPLGLFHQVLWKQQKTEPCKQHRVSRWHHWGRIYGQTLKCPATLDFLSYFFPFLANEWLLMQMQAVWFWALFDLHTVIKVVVESYWSLQFFPLLGPFSVSWWIYDPTFFQLTALSCIPIVQSTVPHNWNIYKLKYGPHIFEGKS